MDLKAIEEFAATLARKMEALGFSDREAGLLVAAIHKHFHHPGLKVAECAAVAPAVEGPEEQ